MDFNRDIRPILSDNCFHCHGPDEKTRKAKLRLDTKEGILKDLGGYQAVKPGDAKASEVWKRIITKDENDVIGRLEYAMEAVITAEPIEKRMRDAQKLGKLPQRTLVERRLAALNQSIITQQEFDHLVYTDRLRRDVIKVDDFEHELGREHKGDEQWQAESRKKAAVASM